MTARTDMRHRTRAKNTLLHGKRDVLRQIPPGPSIGTAVLAAYFIVMIFCALDAAGMLR